MLEKIVSHVQWYTAKGTMDSKLQRITARVAKINTFGLFQQPAISVAKILIRFFPSSLFDFGPTCHQCQILATRKKPKWRRALPQIPYAVNDDELSTNSSGINTDLRKVLFYKSRNILFTSQVDNQYPFEISPSPTFTQMDPYKPQYKVPRSISEEELIR